MLSTATSKSLLTDLLLSWRNLKVRILKGKKIFVSGSPRLQNRIGQELKA
jgi:hypothetical protein